MYYLKRWLLIYILTSIPVAAFNQDNPNSSSSGNTDRYIYGFVRSGFYGSIEDETNKVVFPSVFSDLGIKAESGGDGLFKAFADLRFRFGTEFNEPVKRMEIREAFITLKGIKWDLTAGQQIIKWGRADLTNPTSKISSTNLVSRSPDPADMDQGNLLVDARWHPFPFLSVEAVAMPLYRPSVLMIDPLPLPSYVKINTINSLMTGNNMFGYGIRADMYLKGIDMGLSWFNGMDPMPGTSLTRFDLDMSGPIPIPSTELTLKPYRINNLGFDFETILGSIGIRGEAAWLIPRDSYKTYEYVACQQIQWVAGMDWMPGNWRITAEYSGKTIPGYEAASVEPLIGTEPDLAAMAELLTIPGFNLNEYVRQQVTSFNRLYNYQLEEFYHSAGLRIESELLYGKLTPSILSLYNFTTREIMLFPEIKYKPADALTISLGGEFYSGPNGTIYDLIDDFMNCIRVSLRADF